MLWLLEKEEATKEGQSHARIQIVSIDQAQKYNNEMKLFHSHSSCKAMNSQFSATSLSCFTECAQTHLFSQLCLPFSPTSNVSLQFVRAPRSKIDSRKERQGSSLRSPFNSDHLCRGNNLQTVRQSPCWGKIKIKTNNYSRLSARAMSVQEEG